MTLDKKIMTDKDVEILTKSIKDIEYIGQYKGQELYMNTETSEYLAKVDDKGDAYFRVDIYQ